MKKRVLSLALALLMILTLLPTAAFAAEPQRITEVSVDGYIGAMIGYQNDQYDYVSIDGDAPYNVAQVCWYGDSEQSTALKPMKAGDNFVEGRHYKLYIELEPKAGYEFSKNAFPDTYINDGTVEPGFGGGVTSAGHFYFWGPMVEATYPVGVCIYRDSADEYATVGFEAPAGYVLTSPAEPGDEGRTFCGWYYDRECTEPFIPNRQIYQDLNLYGKWVNDGEEEHISSVEVEFEYPPTAGREAGLYNEAYVGYTAPYTVAESYWFCDFRNDSPSNHAYADNEPFELNDECSFCVVLAPKAGCVFDSDTEIILTDYNGDTIPVDNRYCTKKPQEIIIWTETTNPVERVLFCNGWGGAGTEVIKGYVPGEIDPPGREGYIFAGWYTDEDCTVPFDPYAPILVDTTIYPKWIEEGTQLCGDNLFWTIDEDGTLIISGTGEMYDYEYSSAPWSDRFDEISSIVIEKGVTSIGGYAFSGLYNVESVTIPESVTSIGDYAFSYSDGLDSVNIPASVEYVDSCAFNGCENLTAINVAQGNKYYSSDNGVLFDKGKTVLMLYPMNKQGTSYTIPGTVKTIDYNAFYSAVKLTSVTIPNGVQNINWGAFLNCKGLTSVTIPASVTTIEPEPFGACENLTAINVAQGNKNYCSVDGVLFNKDKTVLHSYPMAKAGDSYTVPAGVKEIENSAFEYSSIKNISLPASLQTIYEYAFWCCEKLAEVHYAGTEAQWDNVYVQDGNMPIENALKYYNGYHPCPFSDISTSAHHKNIEVAYARGYVSGYGGGKYAPNETVTRAQFITMLWRAAGKPVPTSSDLTFKDISADDYCREAIAWGAANGIVSGYDANTFGRNDPVTRAQATTFIARFCANVVGLYLDTDDYGFTDINDAREAFRPYINAMANAGLILGYGATCGPNDKATRGQIASILVRAMDSISWML